MNTEPEIRRALRQRFAAVPPMPDAVLDEVLERVPETPQQHQRTWNIPARRSQAMFSATKFVVAGAIVALFGGFLLSGVLTPQNDDAHPAVGASASASGEIRDDLLPGVELAVEVVSPRLIRVLGDGHRRLGSNIRDVAFAPNGDVWLMREGGNVLRLGEPGVAFRDLSDFQLGHDGILRAGNGTFRLDGRDWVQGQSSDLDFCREYYQHLAPDGTCWTSQFGSLERFDQTLGRVDTGDPDGEAAFESRTDIAPDGRVWTTKESQWGTSERECCTFLGLASYDGSTWTAIDYEGFDVRTAVADMAVGPDGVVWILFDAVGGSLVNSWDGRQWTTHGPWQQEPGYPDRIDFLPDGSLWFGGVAELEGGSLRPIEVLASIGDGTPRVKAVASAADGSAWIVVDQSGVTNGGLYIIRPDVPAVSD